LRTYSSSNSSKSINVNKNKKPATTHDNRSV
jgi:hypothetical protein